MLCERINESTCSEGHRQQWKCHTGQPKTCRTCEREAQRKQKELEAEFDRQSKREQKQAEHAAAMSELDRQIRLAREEAMDSRAAEERAQALEQRKRDLEVAMRLAKEVKNVPLSTKNEALPEQSLPSKFQSPTIAPSHSNRNEQSTPVHANGVQSRKSESEGEWDRQKRVDGVSNDAIDGIMSLTGLEDVKAKILTIKSKIETVLRQGTDMKNERLGLVLLGNPGTGRSHA
jgi:hypothetical protein